MIFPAAIKPASSNSANERVSAAVTAESLPNNLIARPLRLYADPLVSPFSNAFSAARFSRTLRSATNSASSFSIA